MARIINIDATALKRDYEEGMAWPELLKKHEASRTALIKRLRAVGAKLRGRGERIAPSSVGSVMARLGRKTEKRGLGVSRGGSFLPAEAATDLASLLDKQWAIFSLLEKIRAVDHVYGRRAQEIGPQP